MSEKPIKDKISEHDSEESSNFGENSIGSSSKSSNSSYEMKKGDKKSRKSSMCSGSFKSVSLTEEEDFSDEDMKNDKMTVEEKQKVFKNIKIKWFVQKEGSEEVDGSGDESEDSNSRIYKTHVFDHGKFKRQKQLEDILKQSTFKSKA